MVVVVVICIIVIGVTSVIAGEGVPVRFVRLVRQFRDVIAFTALGSTADVGSVGNLPAVDAQAKGVREKILKERKGKLLLERRKKGKKREKTHWPMVEGVVALLQSRNVHDLDPVGIIQELTGGELREFSLEDVTYEKQ